MLSYSAGCPDLGSHAPMQLYASCCTRKGLGVLIIGPSGSGKSSLLLRLLNHGFRLVADDQVILAGLDAFASPTLAGILEVRGLGLTRLAFLRTTRLALVVEFGTEERLPTPRTHSKTGLPILSLRPHCPYGAERVSLALRVAAGRGTQVFGAFV